MKNYSENQIKLIKESKDKVEQASRLLSQALSNLNDADMIEFNYNLLRQAETASEQAVELKMMFQREPLSLGAIMGD